MKKILIRILVIVLILELLIFNFNSYRVLSNKNKKEFSNSNIKYIETNDENLTYIQIENVDTEIKTVHLSLKSPEIVDYEFLYSDETTSNLFGTPTKTYVYNLENSKYIPCYLSGNSENFVIKIYKGNIQVDFVTINEKIPFNFNLARCLILYFIILFIYLIRTDKNFEIPFSKNNFNQEFALLIVLAVFLCIVSYINDFSKDNGQYDFYSKQFVDSIINGNVFLDEEPSEELLKLKNPYDFLGRLDAGLLRDRDYIWDAAFYHGKYYVYFGILPALILLVPYHIITSKYMTCAAAVLIFSILTAISIKGLVKNIFLRFFKEIPFKFMLFSFIILLFGSQILILNGIPRFYELPIISGIFFAITGINFMFKAIQTDEVSYTYMFWSCLFLSLSVACRPTDLFASLIVLPIIVKIFINNIKNKKDILKNILAVSIPYLTVGMLLMYYNYIRFGSIFEFGASYQLTINDMSNLRNRYMVIGMGLICNLLSIPNFIPSFPFLYNHNNLTTFYGYYYIENMIGGLFILVPICLSIFGLYKIFKHSKNKELFYFISIFTLVGLLICVISIMMGGSMQRYMVDYAWILIVAGICAFIEMYHMYKSDEAKNILKRILGILTIYIIIINFCSGIVSEKSCMKNHSPSEFYNLKYSINFWE